MFAEEKCSVTNIWLCMQWVRVILIKFSQLKLEGDLASISCAVSRQSIPAILAICISARGLNLFLTFSIYCLGERLRNGESKKLVWFWMETFKKQLSFWSDSNDLEKFKKFSVTLEFNCDCDGNLAKYKNGIRSITQDAKKQLNTCSLSSL